MESKYTEINSKTFDKWNKEDWKWAQPIISHEVFKRAKNGATNPNFFLLH